jgi:hypothetical protein
LIAHWGLVTMTCHLSFEDDKTRRLAGVF